MKVLIIGCGYIGEERIKALNMISKSHSIDFDITIVEEDERRLNEIKNQHNLHANTNLNEELVKKPDWVFVSAPHSVAADLTIESCQYAKNVLVEKPLGRNLAECDRIINAIPDDVNFHVGLNYRFFQGINLLLNHVKQGLFGDLISVNMVLGHGNSPGMENSWKLDPIKCGGGCLIDPGVHLLDIATLISGSDLKVVGGKIWEGFWNTGIEEEAHIILKNRDSTIFNVQMSLNRWKSSFRLEVNGTRGYGIISGRGRSYGDQSYRAGRRWGWETGKTQTESETIFLDSYAADDSFYECMLSLFSLPSMLIRDSEIYAADQTDGRDVMKLLKQCREELQLNDSC